MMLLLTLLFILLIAQPISSVPQFFNSDGTRWAHECDFPTTSFRQVAGPANQCGPSCVRVENCTHFYWTPSPNATCFLKAGQVTHCDAESIPSNNVCGYLSFRVRDSHLCPLELWSVIGGTIGGLLVILVIVLIIVAHMKKKCCFTTSSVPKIDRHPSKNTVFGSELAEEVVYEEIPTILIHPAPRPPAFIPKHQLRF